MGKTNRPGQPRLTAEQVDAISNLATCYATLQTADLAAVYATGCAAARVLRLECLAQAAETLKCEPRTLERYSMVGRWISVNEFADLLNLQDERGRRMGRSRLISLASKRGAVRGKHVEDWRRGSPPVAKTDSPSAVANGTAFTEIEARSKAGSSRLERGSPPGPSVAKTKPRYTEGKAADIEAKRPSARFGWPIGWGCL
jgi:hypothetical protein